MRPNVVLAIVQGKSAKLLLIYLRSKQTNCN